MMMRLPSLGLAAWLAIISGCLVTMAVAFVSIAGIAMLRDLAYAEARIRVEFAVAAASEALRQHADELHTGARVLGERPTLRRLLLAPDSNALQPYVMQYCETAAMDGCAIMAGQDPLITVGERINWNGVTSAALGNSARFLVTGDSSGPAASGARFNLSEPEGYSVIAVQRLDDALASVISDRVGHNIRFGDIVPTAAGTGSNPSVLRNDAGQFLATLPVMTDYGEIVAVLQASLPVEDAMAPVASLERRMLLVAVLVIMMATVGGVVIGRYWIGGVYRLTAAARRIGRGDLAAAIPDEGGAELGVLARTMDEMRRNLLTLTEEIRRREAQAQAVLGGIVEGVFAVDRKRRIRFLNPKAEMLLSTSAEDAHGRFCGDVLRPAPDASGVRPCERSCPIIAARRDGSAEALEYLESGPGRLRRAVIASAAASDGIQVQVLRDETELEAARRMRDTVLANISHEFRSPLAAQLASVELLRDNMVEGTPASVRELVASFERAAQRLTRLIDNLLESVRIESGRLTIRHEACTLAEIVQAARDLMEPLLDQRGQRLQVQCLDTVPAIKGDLQRLIQVMVNLLANASKFAPPETAIYVGGAALDNGRIAFWVDDEGPGPVDPHDPSLFEQFRRAGSEEPGQSGLGLGLFIVKSIVQRHGGTVILERTAASQTRVQVELPGDTAT
ncbi:MAG: ATP-binding protein [Woeseia sp.]